MSLGNVSGLEERSYHVEFVVMPAKEKGEQEREDRKRKVRKMKYCKQYGRKWERKGFK